MSDKNLPPALTDGQMYDILILEAKNQETKSRILGRMHFLMGLTGSKQMHDQMMGMNQSQEKQSKDSIRVLTGMKQEWERDNAPKAEDVPAEPEKALDETVENSVDNKKKKSKLKE